MHRRVPTKTKQTNQTKVLKGLTLTERHGIQKMLHKFSMEFFENSL